MANNVFTKNYSDGNALTTAQIDTALQSLQMDLAQSAQLTNGASAGQVLTVSSGGVAAVWATPADYKASGTARNYGISASVSSGSLIVALKSAAGTNPTSSDSVVIDFSSNGGSSAVPNRFTLTSSLSLSVTASATLGVKTATTATLYVYAIRQASATLRIGISTNGVLDTGGVATSVAMTSSSDTEGVLYSNASAGTYPVRLLGWIRASHTTGSWNTLYNVNIKNDFGSVNEIANRRTRAISSSVTIGGIAISASDSGSFFTSSSSFVDVTNCNAGIQTTGRPVKIEFIGNSTVSSTGFVIDGGTNTYSLMRILRGTTTIVTTQMGDGVNTVYMPPGIFQHIDNVAAGSYTYKLQIRFSGSGASKAARALNMKMVLSEL